MIISVGDSNDDGTGPKMFSRSGKSTNSQFLAFCNAKRKQLNIRVEDGAEPASELADFDQMANDKKPKNIKDVMRKLEEEERERIAKQRADKKAISGPSDKDQVLNFKPIDLLKEPNFRRQVQSCFSSTTRADWQNAHASKTKPPEVGKYKPKYNLVYTKEKAASVAKEHSCVGAIRKQQRNEQQTCVCLRAIKGLNQATGPAVNRHMSAAEK